MIFAIDPGTERSGWVLFDGGQVLDAGVHPNADVLEWVRHGQGADTLALEMVACYGMAVGRDVFETVRWIGRFQQAWRDPESVRFVYRTAVKLALCNSTKARDPNVRQALIDELGAPGTKKSPGPTYGVTSHAWAALGVAFAASRWAATVNANEERQSAVKC